MENRNARRARRHLQRAQELLGYGLNFGGPKKRYDNEPDEGTTKNSSFESRLMQLPPAIQSRIMAFLCVLGGDVHKNYKPVCKDTSKLEVGSVERELSSLLQGNLQVLDTLRALTEGNAISGKSKLLIKNSIQKEFDRIQTEFMRGGVSIEQFLQFLSKTYPEMQESALNDPRVQTRMTDDALLSERIYKTRSISYPELRIYLKLLSSSTELNQSRLIDAMEETRHARFSVLCVHNTPRATWRIYAVNTPETYENALVSARRIKTIDLSVFVTEVCRLVTEDFELQNTTQRLSRACRINRIQLHDMREIDIRAGDPDEEVRGFYELLLLPGIGNIPEGFPS